VAVVALLAGVLVAAELGCGEEGSEPGFREWMLACSGPSDCGELDCVCGLCTSRCQPVRPGEDGRACKPAAGVCTPPAQVPGASCAGGTIPAGLCAATCSEAADCPRGGEGFRCQRGLCLSDTVEEGCQPADCGPAPGIPNTLCPDGRTVAGPTGRCVETRSGHCEWEIVSCP
jgi:hypothetical protein